MKEKRFAITPGILAIAAGSLIIGMVSAVAFETFAFVGPSASPASGAGAIGSDAANEVSIGTSTPTAGTALIILGSTTNSVTNALKVEESNGTSIMVVRDDDSVSIETTTVSAGNTVIGGNLTVGGTLSAPNLGGGTTISAGNVSSGQFGSGTGGGNYTFPTNVSIGTTSASSYSFLVVNASSSHALMVATSGNVGIGTLTPQSALQVAGAIQPTQINLGSAGAGLAVFMQTGNDTMVRAAAAGGIGFVPNALTIASSSYALYVTASSTVAIGTSTAPVTLNVASAASSTVRIGVGHANPGCIEMYDAVNSTTLMYIYSSSGALVDTTTKPTFCM